MERLIKFWGRINNKILQIDLKFRSLSFKIIFGILCVSLTINYGYCGQNQYINPQTPTFKALEEYLRNGNPAKRAQVMKAEGTTAEILATRIYNAFQIIIYPAFPADRPDITNAALNELHKNPELTTILLLPVINDNKGESWGMDGIESKRIISTYINLCFNIATVEDNKIAYNKLLYMCQNKNKFISDQAKSRIKKLSIENFHVISERYKKDLMIKDLAWLEENYLHLRRYLPFSPEKIIEIFGRNYTEVKNNIKITFIYGGKEIDRESKKKLKIYFDYYGLLLGWEWEEDGHVIGNPVDLTIACP